MSTWQIILAVIGVLLAASWGVVIPAAVSLMTKLKKVKMDYLAAVKDGTITDQEKQVLADDVIAAIPDAINLWQFLGNLYMAILAVIKAAKIRARGSQAPTS